MVWTPIKETPYRCGDPRCDRITMLQRTYSSTVCNYCGELAYINGRPRTTGYALTSTIEAGQDFIAVGDNRLPCSFDLPQCEEASGA